MKNIFICVRNSFKFIFLLVIATALIIGILSIAYRPLYSVTINGEFIGYTASRSKLQQSINEYKTQGDGGNISFIDIQVVPEYSLRLVRRDTETNDEEILSIVKGSGVTYFRYYAIILDNVVRSYVPDRETAEEVINRLRDARSANIAGIAYTQVNRTELEYFTDAATAIEDLFVAPRPVAVVATGGSGSSTAAPRSTSSRPDIGISMIRPTSGVVTARYRQRGYSSHTGLDIAGPTGTPIFAAASGVVTRAGQSGTGYGLFVVISHGNGVETLYAHHSQVLVRVGQTVAQGEKIALMGSTGRSTGSHLHFEVRYHGRTLNPEFFI